MASRWTTAFVEPPIAASATIALRNEPRRQDVARASAGRDHLDRQPAGARGRPRAAGCPAPGVPAMPGIVMPSASATQAIVDAVPIVLQCPRLRIIDDSDLMNVLLGQRARRGPPR